MLIVTIPAARERCWQSQMVEIEAFGQCAESSLREVVFQYLLLPAGFQLEPRVGQHPAQFVDGRRMGDQIDGSGGERGLQASEAGVVEHEPIEHDVGVENQFQTRCNQQYGATASYLNYYARRRGSFSNMAASYR